MSLDQFLLSSDTTDLDYPEIRPTLDLNFARVKALDPRITFTRSSGGSYVGADGLIKLAGVNEARFDHDPYTGESLGLLVEESRTNLVLRSEEFDDAGWSKSGSSIIANATTAPDGTLSADKLVENTANSEHFAHKNRTGSNETLTFSVFAKAGERTILAMQLSNFLAEAIQFNFNLILGTKSTALGGGVDYTNSSASIIPFPNGWYRCIITSTKGAAVNTVNNPTLSSNNNFGGSSVYTGDGTSGIFLWGAQLEQGSFPTSYIPTEASTRTRAADNASITGKNFSEWYRPDEGTIYSNINFYAATSNAAGYKITQGTNLRGLGVQYNTSATSFVARAVAGGFYEIVGPAYSKKVAGRYKIGYSVDASIDGSVPVSSFKTIDPVFGTENQMDIGGARSFSSSNNKFNGTINRITYYNRYLPLSQLQALTR